MGGVCRSVSPFVRAWRIIAHGRRWPITGRGMEGQTHASKGGNKKRSRLFSPSDRCRRPSTERFRIRRIIFRGGDINRGVTNNDGIGPRGVIIISPVVRRRISRVGRFVNAGAKRQSVLITGRIYLIINFRTYPAFYSRLFLRHL